MSDYEQILVEQVDAVLTITLNRPEKLNAYTPVMMGELIRAVTAANDDRSVGAIVVTGAGRGFCAGADIEAVFSKGLDTRPRRPRRRRARRRGHRLGAARPRLQADDRRHQRGRRSASA